MKRVRRRLVLIGFLLQSLSPIVNDFNGLVNFSRWSLEVFRSGGIRYWIGLLVTYAARLRRHDTLLYEQWRRDNQPYQEPHFGVDETPYYVLSSSTIRSGIFETFIKTFPTSQWLGINVSEVGRTIDNIEAAFFTIVHVPCEFEAKWFDLAKTAILEGVDLVYADHDLITDDRYHTPFFKPDFSPYLQGEGRMYPFLAVSKRRLQAVCASDVETWEEIVQFIVGQSKNVCHIPKILGHLREPCPTSGVPELTAEVPESLLPDLSIIIPTCDHLDLLQPCVESIRRSLDSQWYEIIVLNNNSKEPDILEWFEREGEHDDIMIVDAPIEFNWSRLNNIGRENAHGRCLVFMNNDVEVISDNWGRHMASIAQRSDVGAVGPLLLYADETIQHAGVVIGFGGFADHVYSGAKIYEASDSCFVSPCATRSVSAVTGACLMTMANHFDDMGGFDEKYRVAGDVDYCLRLRDKGLSIVFDGQSRMYHYESKTREHGLPADDARQLTQRIQISVPDADPFYNRNLTLSCKFPLFDVFEKGNKE